MLPTLHGISMCSERAANDLSLYGYMVTTSLAVFYSLQMLTKVWNVCMRADNAVS